jgi:hypothetical protein
VKQYQFKLSPDFKRIIVRELADFKERYLRDPKLDGPTGQKSRCGSANQLALLATGITVIPNYVLRTTGQLRRGGKRSDAN